MTGAGLANAAYFMQKEGERINRAHERRRQRITRKARRVAREGEVLQERVCEAEDDLGRGRLLAMAVFKLLLRKKILSRKRITQMAKHVDRWDGLRDGRLRPAVLRPKDQPGPRSMLSPEEFLQQLENEE